MIRETDKNDNRMLANNRQSTIYDMLRKSGSVRTSELKSVLHVSEMTIRRDLEELETRNLVRRVHGGAIPAGDMLSDMSFEAQSEVSVEEKLAIAHKAVELVSDGMHVAIDGSSTGVEFARLLKNLHDITIVTNSLGILLEFRNVPSVSVIILGGSLAFDGNSIDGAFALENAKQLFVDAFFFSCAGFDAEGITNSSPISSEVRKTFIKNAKKKVLLADSTKYGNKGFIKLFGWDDVDVLITDSHLPAHAAEAILQNAPNLDIRITD
jgi:DeoR/GlpR family transcriptional regulator of sugar metabolism